jgi:hypothetical protein
MFGYQTGQLEIAVRRDANSALAAGVSCAACGAPADGSCTGCGKFYCGAHFDGICCSCYDVHRNLYGVQALGASVMAVGFGYAAHVLASGLSAETRDMAPVAWVGAGVVGLAGLCLFWLTVRPFPAKRAANGPGQNTHDAGPNAPAGRSRDTNL